MHDKIVFRCECGASLGAPKSAAGRRGKCKHCGRVLTVPGKTSDAPTDIVEIIEEFCSICQTTIEQDEPQTRCDACGLPFHEECWQENLGCSAYGCSNVNVLKAGPDLRITSPPPLQRADGLQPLPDLNAVGDFQPTADLRPATGPRWAHDQGSELPWEYVILSGSAISVLLGLLCFGVAPLIALIGVVVFLALRRDTERLPVLIAAMVITALGILFGLIASLVLYL